jgi:hypothetical protein
LRTSGRCAKTICAKMWARENKNRHVPGFFYKITNVQVMKFIPVKDSTLYSPFNREFYLAKGTEKFILGRYLLSGILLILFSLRPWGVPARPAILENRGAKSHFCDYLHFLFFMFFCQITSFVVTACRNREFLLFLYFLVGIVHYFTEHFFSKCNLWYSFTSHYLSSSNLKAMLLRVVCKKIKIL